MAKMWPTEAAQMTFEKRLGRGFFGEVWQCRRLGETPEATPLAVKKIPLAVIEQHRLMDQLEREINVLRVLRHPHIVKLLFDFRDSSHAYLGMEFAEGGTMFDRLSRSAGGKFTSDIAARYFYETCDALAYLHGLPEKVIHRDIKPENILLDKENKVKLADFGWAGMMENVTSRGTFCGTTDYLAPEMIKKQGHNESLDMWEMGVLLYEMVIGRSPFGSSTPEKTCMKIVKVDLRFPHETDADARDLVVRLCRLKPDERLTAVQAMEHAFVVRNHKGRPTTVVGAPATFGDGDGGVGRPSVEVRRMQRDREVLEGEMMHILQAKSHTEQQLLTATTDLEDAYKQLKLEQKKTQRADKELRRLTEMEQAQVQEAAELRRANEALEAAVLELRRPQAAQAQVAA